VQNVKIKKRRDPCCFGSTVYIAPSCDHVSPIKKGARKTLIQRPNEMFPGTLISLPGGKDQVYSVVGMAVILHHNAVLKSNFVGERAIQGPIGQHQK